jgi:hypothetical protein
MVFESAPNAPDAEYVLSWDKAPSATIVFEVLHKAGFPGGTLAGNELIVVGPHSAKAKNAATLAKTLSARLETRRGHARLLDQAQYEKSLAAYDAFPHTCPWRQ